MAELLWAEQVLSDYSAVRESLRIRLASTEWKKDELEGKAQLKAGEFTETFVISGMVQGGTSPKQAEIDVTEAMLDEWGVSIDRIHADALKAQLPGLYFVLDIVDMDNGLVMNANERKNIFETGTVASDPRLPYQMYILTNQENRYGASLMASDGLMQAASTLLEADLVVLPSSIHEVILIPDDGCLDPEFLSGMVQSVNESEVEAQDRLSDDPYSYCKKDHTLTNLITEKEIDLRTVGNSHGRDAEHTKDAAGKKERKYKKHQR